MPGHTHTYTGTYEYSPVTARHLSSSHHDIWHNINVGKLVPCDPMNSSVSNLSGCSLLTGLPVQHQQNAMNLSRIMAFVVWII